MYSGRHGLLALWSSFSSDSFRKRGFWCHSLAIDAGGKDSFGFAFYCRWNKSDHYNGSGLVVICSMIGGGGLGEKVLKAVNQINVGKGFEAGWAILVLAIVIDRISQGFAQKWDTSTKQASSNLRSWDARERMHKHR